MSRVRRYRNISVSIALVILGSLMLTLLDPRSSGVSGWFGYLVIGGICGVLIWLSWRWVTGGRKSGYRWLLFVFILSLLLRLGLGVALTYLLPRYGYDEEPQQAGYVFRDAYVRDRESWDLAQSEDPLITAFTERSRYDQYGGLLYLSGSIYRFLSPDIHRPLLIVTLGATISSLAVLFTWAFTSMLFGLRAAAVAGWILALYPDAVLLSASQMREPFIITTLAIAFYGFAHLREGRTKIGLSIIIAPIVLLLPISPPYAFAILVAVGVGWLWEVGFKFRQLAKVVIPIVGVAIVAGVLIIQAWSTIRDLPGSGLEIVLEWWKTGWSQSQQNLVWLQSDWTRHLLRSTPEWAHLPLIVIYGLIRPFLPAGIVDRGALLWRSIAIWRGLGWVLLLPFLLYAPVAALRRRGWRSLPTYFSVLVWVMAIIASYRGAGDQWDNPRYRFVFLAIQVALAGWAWVNAHNLGSPWLVRTFTVVGGSIGLFTLWYGFRYAILQSFGILHAIATVGAFVIIFIAGSLALDYIRIRRSSA